MIRAVHLVLALLATGCGGSGAHVATLSPEALERVDALQLCAAYGDAQGAGSGAVKGEIMRRGLLTDQEWQAAAERRIFVGMTACGLLAARGDPRPAGSIDRLGMRTGPYLQWVYRAGDGTPPLYIYTDNGRIIGWQQ